MTLCEMYPCVKTYCDGGILTREQNNDFENPLWVCNKCGAKHTFTFMCGLAATLHHTEYSRYTPKDDLDVTFKVDRKTHCIKDLQLSLCYSPDKQTSFLGVYIELEELITGNLTIKTIRMKGFDFGMDTHDRLGEQIKHNLETWVSSQTNNGSKTT